MSSMSSMPPEKSPEESPPGQVPDEPPSGEEERELSQGALQELSQDTRVDRENAAEMGSAEAPIWPEATSNPGGVRTRRPLLRGGWFIAAAVLLALVLGATLILPSVFEATRPSSSAITIDPTTHIACPLDATWSPNGHYIAVLGYQDACPNSDPSKPYDTGQVSIYSAGTGGLVRSLSLDEGVAHSLRIPLGPTVTRADGSVFAPFIGYQSVLWSPDGNQLAFPFVVLQVPHVFPAPNVPSQMVAASPPAQAGVLLLNLGKNLSVTRIQVDTMAAYNLPRTGYPSSIEWDLQKGSAAALNLPPALSYTWDANGRLVPVERLNPGTAPAATPPVPVGNPIGGKSFTIWQPGLASQGYYLNQMGGNGPPTSTVVPGVDLWYSYFAIWSPDGRYLISPDYFGGRMALPSQPVPNSVALQATGQGQAPVFSPHDPALQTSYLSAKDAPAAWRPDGDVMATLSYRSTSSQASTAVVTLWDCRLAKVLATYSVTTGSTKGPIFGLDGLVGSSTLAATLRWSPDGSHLLLLNSLVDSRITIWPTNH